MPISQPHPIQTQAPAVQQQELPEPSTRGVVYAVTRCPTCNSKSTKVTSTRGKIRMHKCKECGHNFKSVEQD